MDTPVVTVEGIVKPDGTVEVPGKVDLPAGKVHVTWPRLSASRPSPGHSGR